MKNKVCWLDWSKKSFEKAKKEDKPILLDLTAVWCHWCHVMDATSYSSDEIATIISRDFVPIKVYIDKRPDIRERYNMGGFPSTVFLNPDGFIIAGDTYVPPERFKLLLETVKNGYKDRKDEIKKKIAETTEKILEKKEAGSAILNEGMIQKVLSSIDDNFDSFYGGFGTQPKFPMPEALDLLFIQFNKTKDKKYVEMALKTLDGMKDGLYDGIDFGFFRYSVTQDWKTPHYEKMLDTNAGLLKNYAVAFGITRNEAYKKITLGILSYINKFLSDRKNGGFYGSQDADEEFYQLKSEERSNKEYPHVDKTLYIDWNAIMISSYIKAGAVLGDKETLNFAIKTADFILEKCYSSKTGIFHNFDGKASVNGLLSDNIYFLNCLIDIFFFTQEKKYLERIGKIAGYIMKNFYDKNNHGFFDRVTSKFDLGALKFREKNFLENSFSAMVFLRLGFVTKEEKYIQAAENTLLHFANKHLHFGYFSATYAIAVDMALNGKIQVDIFGRKDMVNACIASCNPGVVVNFIGKNSKNNSGYEIEGAYVCKGTLCKGPIKDNDKLEEEIRC